MTFIKAVLGLQGCGKTMYMTAEALKWNRKEVPIYSNYHLKTIPYTPITSIDDCNKMRNGVALLDEFYHWVFARSSMTKVNKEMVNILTMNRKRNMSIYYSAQLYRTIDVIIRDLTNRFIYPEIKINNEKKYIYYKEYDLLGRKKCYKRLRHDTEYYGELYDTNQEIKNLDESNSFSDNGKPLEDQFFNYMKRKKNILVIRIPNSGQYSRLPYDFIVFYNGVVYCVDVKSVRSRGRITTNWITKGNDIEDKVKVAKDFNCMPFWAVFFSQRWHFINLTDINNFNYLKYVKDTPVVGKLKMDNVFSCFPI